MLLNVWHETDSMTNSAIPEQMAFELVCFSESIAYSATNPTRFMELTNAVLFIYYYCIY